MASLKVEKLAERIEYNGEVYEKVTGDAEKGDLVKALRDDLDITAGNFYEVLKCGEDYVYFRDDADDYQGRLKRNYEVYRKVTTKYREVKRKAKAGEKIRIVKAESTNGLYSNGVILSVKKEDRWGDGSAVTPVEIDHTVFHREYVVLEPIEEPKRLQVGDYAKVIDTDDTPISVGDIVKVTKFAGDPLDLLNFETMGGKKGAMYGYRFVPATAEEVAEAKRKLHEASIKPGDYVRVIVDTENLPEGTFGKVTEVDEEVFYTHKVETLDGSNYDLFTVSQLEKVDEQTAKWGAIGRKVGEFKVGDVVKCLRSSGGHPVGSIGVVAPWPRGFISHGRHSVAVDINGIVKDHTNHVELIAPAESVVNLSV